MKRSVNPARLNHSLGVAVRLPLRGCARNASALSAICLALATATGCGDDFGNNPPPGAGGSGTAGESDAGANNGGANNGGAGGEAKGGRGGTSATKGGSTGKGGSFTQASSGGTTNSEGGTSSTAGGTAATGGTATTGGTTATAGGTTAAAGGKTSTTGGTSSVAAGGTSASGGANSSVGGTGFGGTGTSTGGTGSSLGGTSSAGGTTAGTTVPSVPAVAILKYEFDSTTDTVAHDSTSNGNDGTLTDVTLLSTGRNGGGAQASAATSEIAMPVGLFSQVDELSVSAWVKLSSNPAGSRLFTFGNGTTSYLYLALNNGDTTTPGISLKYLSPGGTEQEVTTPTQLPLNVWKHVTVTLSAAGAAIFVDGKVVAQKATVSMLPSGIGTQTANIVGNSESGDAAFQGQIDEFHVYDGQLTTAEIRALAAPKTDYSMYHFDEGTGTAVADASERAKNGTLIGGATWVDGVFGTAVKLDNPSNAPAAQYVDLADGLIQSCGTNLTIAGWINLETNHGNADFFSVSLDVNTAVRLATTYVSGGGAMTPELVYQIIYMSSGTTLNTRTYRVARTWTLGQWYHIAAVRSGTGTTVELYVDGAPLTVPTTNGTALAFSSWGSTTLNFFGRGREELAAKPGVDGSIDEMLISCRAYKAGEIMQLAYRP